MQKVRKRDCDIAGWGAESELRRIGECYCGNQLYVRELYDENVFPRFEGGMDQGLWRRLGARDVFM